MRRDWSDPWVKLIAALSAAVVAVVGALALAGVFSDDGGGGDGKAAAVPTEVQLDGPARADGDPAKDTVMSPAPEAQVVKQVSATIEDENTRDDPEVSAPIQAENEPLIEKQTSGSDVVPERATLATFSQPGCETRAVGNFSSRSGQRPGLIVLHYTVSPNRAGTGDVASIVVFFNNPRAQASSNYVVDNEGHCAYIVSELNKAWTQGNMNPASACSFEVINTGHEATYIGPAGGPGLRKLARVVSDCAKRWGIPLRIGATNGCSVTLTGIVDHDSLACNNFHTDIKPFSVSQVLQAAIAYRQAAECDAACRAKGRQRELVKARDGKHARVHATMRELGCRKRIHSHPPAAFNRRKCRRQKVRDVRKRRLEAAARARYRSL